MNEIYYYTVEEIKEGRRYVNVYTIDGNRPNLDLRIELNCDDCEELIREQYKHLGNIILYKL